MKTSLQKSYSFQCSFKSSQGLGSFLGEGVKKKCKMQTYPCSQAWCLTRHIASASAKPSKTWKKGAGIKQDSAESHCYWNTLQNVLFLLEPSCDHRLQTFRKNIHSITHQPAALMRSWIKCLKFGAVTTALVKRFCQTTLLGVCTWECQDVKPIVILLQKGDKQASSHPQCPKILPKLHQKHISILSQRKLKIFHFKKTA